MKIEKLQIVYEWPIGRRDVSPMIISEDQRKIIKQIVKDVAPQVRVEFIPVVDVSVVVE